MILYNKCNIEIRECALILTTVPTVQFDNKNDESYSVAMPQCWSRIIQSEIPLADYSCYFICSASVPHSKYNRITDYKKVWGLNSIDVGVYDNSYMNKNGKVYFGIYKSQGESVFSHSISQTAILVKNSEIFDHHAVFEYFAESMYDLKSNNNLNFYVELHNLLRDSIILHYFIDNFGVVNFQIFSDNVDSLFMRFRECDCNNAGTSVDMK